VSLVSWNTGAAQQAIVEFVQRTVSDAVPMEERVAVFDNDGNLWCEKPMPIQLDFILRRLIEMAEADADLRGRQPWLWPVVMRRLSVGNRPRASGSTMTLSA
jgi:hypothetical protein